MQHLDDFDDKFKVLTGLQESDTPFPWQRALYEEFLDKRFRKNCDIPTGLGKTSVIAIWLLALAHHVCAGTVSGFPRRLVYVVNRRTVVDQATREAEQMREALSSKPALQAVTETLQSLAAISSDIPLAISTLRGQFADNAEWRNDPARPAVIVGTVDMIGSRLLFSGYGRGFKSRPLHAGFLGQDTLLVHDEAHLEPAFHELITAIESEQKNCGEFGRFRVMALTATARSDENSEKPLFIEEVDCTHSEEAKNRFKARKWISFHPVDDMKKIPDKVAELAKGHRENGQAILVFLHSVEHVEKVVGEIRKAKLAVQTLTGTLRGLERDALAREDPIFARLMPKPPVTPKSGSVYLVCTSAGEVGVNISADHLVCDLTPFDSMAQRFGRVNRFGKGDAQIDVVHSVTSKTKDATEVGFSASNDTQRGNDLPGQDEDAGDTESKKKSPFEQACERTLSLLQHLPKCDDQRYDASPKALNSLPVVERIDAFTPAPVILPPSDIIFDAWALTSVRQKLPGRPPVADWLHGIADWELPDTYVAWREEVAIITKELREKYKPEDLLDDYPLKPHELLRDLTIRVFRHMEKIAERCPDQLVWLIESDGKISVLTLAKLVEKNRQNKPMFNLGDCTVLLPPEAGGLRISERRSEGLFDSAADYQPENRNFYDVADEWNDDKGQRRRVRVWDDDPEFDTKTLGQRLIRVIELRSAEEDEDAPSRSWYWYERPRTADDDGSRTSSREQDLEPHLQSTERLARRLVAKLGLNELEASAVRLAVKWHDFGKNRRIWQLSIGNRDPNRVLAKSGGKMRPMDLSSFRHEFGSLLDIVNLSEFRELKPEVQDLVLHLVAAHHGRARPHFPVDEVFDPERPDEVAAAIAREVPRRFGRLQRTYGRWGLAYLESLVRAADALASQEIQEASL